MEIHNMNTTFTAKSTFQEGLVMDFAPDNTQATILTSALNATLLTFNGNEMSLQNDMGNGRVETAYLPEGYIPVGTCEFGDIIYIVSYNPLTNQSQIGCFPSPERNISSEEIYYAGGGGFQSLNTTEFQELTGGSPNGTLKNTSVKKVLIDSKKLNPGDKYIIYSDNNGISGNTNCLSDLASNTKHGDDPKNIKLHIVSIDDTGKITYLDSTTKWYDVGEGNKYYIDSQANKDVNGNKVPDIDSYRNLLQSGWSIFSSKVSGKLAILAELETIETFSCSYELTLIESGGESYTERGNIRYKSYQIHILPEWTKKQDGKDLSYILVTKSEFNNNYIKEDEKGNVINNTYKYKATNNISSSISGGYEKSDIKEDGINIGSVEIPYQEKIDDTWVKITSPSFVYTMDITPAMNFGRLDYLTVTIEIDFNKVGTGEVELTEWKYHNSGTTSIIQYGVNIYPKPQWEVENIIMQFSDNIGLVGEYKLDGKKSYSGTHIEYFGLDGEAYNYKFSRQNSVDFDPPETIRHPGTLVENSTGIDVNKSDTYCEYNGEIYNNDARTLYSGYLYLVKIIVNQRHSKNNTLKSATTEYRWYWTNSMFNEYFYQVKDFKDLNFELILNGEALFKSNALYQWKQKELNNLATEFGEGENWKTYSANAQYIGKDRAGNINMYMNAGLQNNYDCFNLNRDSLETIDLEIWLASAKISYNLPDNQYQFSDKETSVSDIPYLSLQNTTIKNGTELLTTKFNYLDNPTSLNASKIVDITKNITDGFNIYFVGTNTSEELEEVEGEPKTQAPYFKTTLDKCYYRTETDNKAITLSMQAILFNKAYVQDIYSGSVQVPVYTPIINSLEDLKALGISHKVSANMVSLAFNSAMALSNRKDDFSGIDLHYDESTMSFDCALEDDNKYGFSTDNRVVNVSNDVDFIDKIWGNASPRLSLFFPVFLGGFGSNRKDKGTKDYNAVNGSANSYANVRKWQSYRSWVNNRYPSNPTANNSLLTQGAFDIDGDGNFSNVKNETTISFLGMKYKEGMTVLNSAFVDSYDTSGFLQKDLRKSSTNEYGEKMYDFSYYDNFAYQLYLILSNTYHKGKRIEDTDINIKNYVRNGNYTVELLKNIVVKLQENSKHNILLRGIPFYEGKDGNSIMQGFNKINPEGVTKAGVNNITLKLLEYAKNHEVKIQVKSQPLSFLNTDVNAYIMRNGILIPSKNLANNFYIYQNGELQQYANKLLTFPLSDVTTNLQYLIGSTEHAYKLQGADVKVSYHETDFDKAYNYYLQQLRDNLGSNYEESYYSEWEAQQRVNAILNQAMAYMDETAYGYSKERIVLDVMYNEFLTNVVYYEISHNTQGGQVYIVKVNTSYDFNKHIKKGTMVPEDHYKIDSYFNLNKFKYENGLVLDQANSFSTFGARDNTDTGRNCAFGGFIRDIVVDLNYQVVQR